MKAHGVRVKLVEPGHFKTGFITRSLEWANHPAYEGQLANYRAWMVRADEKAPGPERVAEVIFKAATDRSDRLRYGVKSGAMLAFHAILPDAVWRSLHGAGLTRHPNKK